VQGRSFVTSSTMEAIMKHETLGGRFLTAGYEPTVANQIRSTYRGQAHFANTGPRGSTCGGCANHGVEVVSRNAAGDVVSAIKKKWCCRKFLELRGEVGPPVPPEALACRHYERRN
jgi:hypothetical protein